MTGDRLTGGAATVVLCVVAGSAMTVGSARTYALAKGHGLDRTATLLRYELSDSAWKSGGGREYQRALKQALADAHADKFKVLIVWALDRIVRDDEGGAEAALRIIRLFRQAGVVIVVSVQEPWLNGAGEVQDVLVAFAGWVAQRESVRKSERIRNGLSRRRAEGKPVGRQPGAADKKKRKRSGYVASWEGGARRAAHNARTAAGHEEA